MQNSTKDDVELAKIPCNTLVHRALLRKRWIDPDSNSVLPDAYIPRAKGQDDDGLSVIRARTRSPEKLIEEAKKVTASFNKTYGVATLHTGWIRNIDDKLDVIPDPQDEQPSALFCHVGIAHCVMASAAGLNVQTVRKNEF